MTVRKIYSSNEGRLLISIPAFLRDKFNLEKGDTVDVDCNNEQIIITPIRETENKE
ncbi:AbrB/MazE/SpoVT family DNA-binding domain-containing protein [Methanococcoides sp. AM1]|uniref:AbrB/MazE/SpoVT family DNA-binding domain-containing protein n=1 Tax=Methanococcoides sp. AM1 TaxID=1201011 RepID=UPI00108478ED|nr:AbrB/MazE/SpoVT family DNA-binding domain-containing protein [Methanococcoides sp. AM1]